MPVSRRKFLKIAAGSAAVLGASAVAGGAYIARIEPEAVEMTRLDIVLSNLPRAFDGLTLVQISDLHPTCLARKPLRSGMGRKRLSPFNW